MTTLESGGSDAGRLRPVSPLWPALVIATLALGCETQSPDTSEDAWRNDVAPTSNALVSGNHVSGDPASQSSIYGTFEVGDGTWLAFGLDDGIGTLSRHATNGAPMWSKRVASYSITGTSPISTSWLPVGAITVGRFDSDADGRTDNSRVTAWGPDGALLDEIVLGGGNLRRSASNVAIAASAADRLDLLVLGSAVDSAGTSTGWAARVSLRSDNTLERGDERTYPTLERCALFCVQRDQAGSAFYVGGEARTEQNAITNSFVLAFSDSLDIQWRTNLEVTPGLVTVLGGDQALRWTGNSLIAVGSTEAVKEKPPGDGGYWDAAVAVSLSPQGTVQWMRSVTVSRFSDHYTACSVDGAFAYAAGQAAAFERGDHRRSFGYGLLTKFDLVTGAVVINHTFGDPAYRSGFNAVLARGDEAWCAGYTELHYFGSFRRWFVEIDFTRPTAIAAGEFDTRPDGRRMASLPAAAARAAQSGDELETAP